MNSIGVRGNHQGMSILRAFLTSTAIVFGLSLVLAMPLRSGLAQSITYVDGFDALPVMTGLAQADESLIFDTPAGRILQARLEGAVDYAESVAFYRATLRSLGWFERHYRDGNMLFVREDEALHVQWNSLAQDRTGITFELNPAPAR